MSIIDRIKSTIIRRLTVREPDGWISFADQSDSGETVTETSAMALSAVWACTNLIAGTIASIPLMVYKSDGVSKSVANKHPLYRLLHDSPNYDQTAVDFLEYVSAAIELKGDAYARKDYTGTRLTSLTPIYAPVQARRRDDGNIEYTWSEAGRSHRCSDEEILHIRGFGGGPLGGMSTLHYARNAFGLARSVDRAAGVTFKNGMRPSGALTFPEFLSKENREIAENRLTAKYLGALNSGKPLILEGGTTWQSIALNPEDAQMLESRRFSIEEICRFFGVPPVLIGHSEKNSSWPSSVEAQAILLVKFTLRRRLKRIEQSMMKQLLTAADLAAGITIEFNIEGLLRGDSAARATFYQSALTNGWMTINEVRALENKPPVAGGNVPRMQMQNVPITEAGDENPS